MLSPKTQSDEEEEYAIVVTSYIEQTSAKPHSYVYPKPRRALSPGSPRPPKTLNPKIKPYKPYIEESKPRTL